MVVVVGVFLSNGQTPSSLVKRGILRCKCDIEHFKRNLSSYRLAPMFL